MNMVYKNVFKWKERLLTCEDILNLVTLKIRECRVLIVVGVHYG